MPAKDERESAKAVHLGATTSRAACPWCGLAREDGSNLVEVSNVVLHGLTCGLHMLEELLREVQRENDRGHLQLPPALERRIIETIGADPRMSETEDPRVGNDG